MLITSLQRDLVSYVTDSGKVATLSMRRDWRLAMSALGAEYELPLDLNGYISRVPGLVPRRAAFEAVLSSRPYVLKRWIPMGSGVGGSPFAYHAPDLGQVIIVDAIEWTLVAVHRERFFKRGGF